MNRLKMMLIVSAVALPFVACKGGQHGSCMEEATQEWQQKDECWVWHEEKNCAGAHRTFVPQDSRDKSELYCSLEGYKAAPGQPSTVMYRPREKKN